LKNFQVFDLIIKLLKIAILAIEVVLMLR